MTSRPHPYRTFVVALIALLLVAEVGARLWERSTDPIAISWYDAATQLRAEQFDDRGQVDVVFAGTSMAWQAMVPRQFTAADPADRSAFNAGLAGGVPAVSEPWLVHHVVPELEPDLVVWGLSTLDFSSSYGDANEQAWNSARESKPGILGAVERFTAQRSALIRWRQVMRDPSQWLGSVTAEAGIDLADAAATLGADGERRDFEFDVGERRAAVQRVRLANMALDEADVAAVLRAIDVLREQDVEVVLVQLPSPDRFTELHPGRAADIERTRELVRQIGADTEVRVIDLTDGFSDNDFVDFTHLNEAGAKRLTERLAEALSISR